MKIDVDRHGNLRVRELFSGAVLETAEGNGLGVCMRDDTFELNILPRGVNTGNWWRVNMRDGTVEKMRGAFHSPAATLFMWVVGVERQGGYGMTFGPYRHEEEALDCPGQEGGMIMRFVSGTQETVQWRWDHVRRGWVRPEVSGGRDGSAP